MSDLYLILRHRLTDTVAGRTDWVEIETEVLRRARMSAGLSYEAMGRKLNVASKTWERWEKDGRIPRRDLPRVAKILELEIDWPRTPIRIEVPEDQEQRLTRVEEQVAGLRDDFADVRQGVADLRALLQPPGPNAVEDSQQAV